MPQRTSMPESLYNSHFVKEGMNILREVEFMRGITKSTNIIDVPVYVISLPNAKKRQLCIKDNAKMIGIDITMVNGVVVNKYDSAAIVVPSGLTVHMNNRKILLGVTLGELGCTLAHLSVMYSIYLRSKSLGKYVVVCEDDILFDPLRLLSETLFTFTENAPSDWEILQLQPTNNPRKLTDSYSTVHSYGTVCYCIKVDAVVNFFSKYLNANNILQLSDFINVNIRADHFLYNIFKTYTNYKHVYVLWNNSLHSSQIHPNMDINHTKRSKLAAQKAIRDYVSSVFSADGNIYINVAVCGMVITGKINLPGLQRAVHMFMVPGISSMNLTKTSPARPQLRKQLRIK